MESKYKILKKSIMLLIVFVGILMIHNSVSAEFYYDEVTKQGNGIMGSRSFRRA